MNRPIGWGIIGPGQIAQAFAGDIALRDRSRLVAVGSRSKANADRFADRFSCANRYDSYEQLVADPAVDVVYVATPHPMHRPAILLALAAGKAVLSEKPLTMNAREAAEVIAEARGRNLFLMEGMWTRFFPAIHQVRSWIAEGRIGEIRAVQAAFGFRGPNDPAGRLLSHDLGGGALLDVGVYPVSFASMILGEPSDVSAHADIGPTGVDEQTSMILAYENGAMATLGCAVRTQLPNDAFIIGTTGTIKVHGPFWRPVRISLLTTSNPDAVSTDQPGRTSRNRFAVSAGKRLRTALISRGHLGSRAAGIVTSVGHRLFAGGNVANTATFDETGHGFHHEIAEVERCLDAGLVESPLMPLDESLGIMRTLDRLREKIDLRYDADA